MRKFHIKRNPGSLRIEPANPSPHTSSMNRKSTVLETIAEIACLIASLTMGWISWIVF